MTSLRSATATTTVYHPGPMAPRQMEYNENRGGGGRRSANGSSPNSELRGRSHGGSPRAYQADAGDDFYAILCAVLEKEAEVTLNEFHGDRDSAFPFSMEVQARLRDEDELYRLTIDLLPRFYQPAGQITFHTLRH
uniref:Type VI secretion system tip protein VgrG n=1 Tax=Globodera pallida TaxID=36090 RepID=A0A183BSY2_GLOPA